MILGPVENETKYHLACGVDSHLQSYSVSAYRYALYGSGLWQVRFVFDCNGKLYSLTQPIQAPGTTCGLYSTDIEGFTVEKLIEIDGFIPYGYVGAMACKGGF